MPTQQTIISTEINKPITTPFLIGHLSAETEFFNCFKSGHFHHSWIITGEKGIGKATFAYRIIRYIFSLNNQDLVNRLNLDTKLDIKNISEDTQNFDYEEENEDEYSSTSDFSQSYSETQNNISEDLQKLDTSPLKLPPQHPIFERLNVGGLTDLKIIEREYTDTSKTKLKSEISVEQIRDLKEFFSKTSSEGGYKIALIDSVDDMNPNSSNALLKILEEAPNKSILLLVCNNYENLLDTIKSRCRILKFHPLSDENMKILLHNYIKNISDEEIEKLTLLSNGSIGTALNFYNNNGLEILSTFYKSIPDILSKKNKSILDIVNIIGNSEIKLKIFEQVFISFIDNLIRLNSNLNNKFSSNEQEKIIKFSAKYFTNPDKLFKIREKSLSYFELTPILNLDYMAIIISTIERLKNAY